MTQLQTPLKLSFTWVLALLLSSTSLRAEDTVESAAEPVSTDPASAEPLARTPVAADVASQDTSPQTGAETTSDPYAQLKRAVELQEYEPSLVEVEQIIVDIERRSHRYDPALATPLLIRGDIKFALEDYDGALDDYARSVHVQRVNTGLHHPAQVEAVYREAATLKRLGEVREANGREEYAYEVLRKYHGAYSPDILPGLYHLAGWHTATNNIFAARRLYGQAVVIVESTEDELSPNLIEPLMGLAATYRLERFPIYYSVQKTDPVASMTANQERYRGAQPLTLNNYPAGEKALKRIVRIREANAEAEPVKLAEAIIDLADWSLLFEKYSLAAQYYQHAQLLLTEAHAEAADALFAKPVLLHFPKPSDPKPPPQALRNNRQTGYVALSFTITPRGTVTDIETIESVPAGLMDFRVRKSMRAARFRPPLVNGELNAATAQQFRHEYTYYPSSTDTAPSATKPTARADKVSRAASARQGTETEG